MRLALIATTYERPDALTRVFETITRQSSAPDELLVADDGSGPETRAVVEGFAAGSSFPVRHVWREHQGFQPGRMRNRAIAEAKSEYVVLIDGDMLLHPEFIADHRRAARRGRYTQGTRVLLNDSATRQALATGELPRFASPGLGGRRRLYAWRAPRMSRLVGRLSNSLIAVKSCNQGHWREDLLKVNGFDESLSGWGSADKELCARLENAGVVRRSILFAAIAFHLGHPPADRSSHARNTAELDVTRATGRVWCEHGIVTREGQAPSSGN
jgi:glycosyltransferase involved in cell wall biosynthesis